MLFYQLELHIMEVFPSGRLPCRWQVCIAAVPFPAHACDCVCICMHGSGFPSVFRLIIRRLTELHCLCWVDSARRNSIWLVCSLWSSARQEMCMHGQQRAGCGHAAPMNTGRDDVNINKGSTCPMLVSGGLRTSCTKPVQECSARTGFPSSTVLVSCEAHFSRLCTWNTGCYTTYLSVTDFRTGLHYCGAQRHSESLCPSADQGE